MKKVIFMFCAMLCAVTATAQSGAEKVWRHHHEKEYMLHSGGSEFIDEISLDYNNRGLVRMRYIENLGAVDSIVYEYNDIDSLVLCKDYRGGAGMELMLYTQDEYTYDPIIRSLRTLSIGHQQVDNEWTVYKADKIVLTRDEAGQIVKIADYTPGEEGMPDIPKTYVKTLTYKDGKLDSYTVENYGYDIVTEEAYLEVSEKWTDITWDRYEGDVLDMGNCFMGPNRVKSARIYNKYYGTESDLTVTYGGANPDDFEAVEDVVGVPQRKVHSLCMTDEYGSAVEEFRTYNTAEGVQLATVQRVTVEFDEHRNQVKHEVAITKDRDNPELVSVRDGEMMEYTYDPAYGDAWVTRTAYKFYQDYDGVRDGHYEARALVERSEWKQVELSGVHRVTVDAAASAPVYDLQGRPARIYTRGMYIQNGRKVLK